MRFLSIIILFISQTAWAFTNTNLYMPANMQPSYAQDFHYNFGEGPDLLSFSNTWLQELQSEMTMAKKARGLDNWGMETYQQKMQTLEGSLDISLSHSSIGLYESPQLPYSCFSFQPGCTNPILPAPNSYRGHSRISY